MKTKTRKEDVENIQIDHGIIFKNYGLETQKLLAPIRGGSTFKVERTIRQIEFDGQGGKTKGTEVIDDENATISAKALNSSLEYLSMALPGTDLTKDDNDKITKIESSNLGLIDDSNYIENITMFAKTIKGDYLKITIANAMADNGLEFAAVQKAEGEIQLDFSAHHEYEDIDKKIYSIEKIKNFNYDFVPITLDQPGKEEDLYGLNVENLQENINFADDGKVTGKLKYVTSYPGFSNVEDEQEGNYLALKVKEATEGKVVTCQKTGSKRKVTLTNDGILVAKIQDKQTKITIICESNSKVLDLSSLELEAKVE